jgi:hypothetical protein
VREVVRQILRRVEERYLRLFAEPGDAAAFKHLIDQVDACIDVLEDPAIPGFIKAMDYYRTVDLIDLFCEHYAKHIDWRILLGLRRELVRLLKGSLRRWSA